MVYANARKANQMSLFAFILFFIFEDMSSSTNDYKPQDSQNTACILKHYPVDFAFKWFAYSIKAHGVTIRVRGEANKIP